ncbi:MAG: 2-C-methyl-D-erythritol 2,4-cyclodiphosphate synthase, partial [Caulobacteraceae bacterium]
GERHVRALLDALETADGAAPLLPVSDTLKRDGAGGYSTVDRAGLHRAQTPQAFRFGAIAAAYDALPLGAAPTDDAGVLEAAAGAWAAVDGDPMLMKITYAEDWRMAEALAGAARRTRVGMGYDVHRFGPGDSVWLCGVQIPHSQGVIGHSDADVGLHALTDALLGAIGAGDIGEHFPPSDPQWSGAASSLFVRHAVELAAQRGGRIANADITLICEAPRVGPHRAAMRETVAGLLGLNVEAVSVKATTTEGLGFTGRGEGLAAQAVVSVEVPA